MSPIGPDHLAGESRWHVPFRGRHVSLATQQNFLWQSRNVFIMDNHRAAMWCWLQCVAPEERVVLLHIDEHFDTLYSRMGEWLAHLPDLRGLSIAEYLSLTFPNGHEPLTLIQWDNYLSLFLERYGSQIAHAVFVTHEVGDPPRLSQVPLMPRPANIPANLAYYLDHPEPAIINIDLDYFFCSDDQDVQRLLFSDEYITAVFRTIRAHLDAGRVACLTICLTPDEGYTGGWAQAEALCDRVCRILGVEFSLPPEPVACP